MNPALTTRLRRVFGSAVIAITLAGWAPVTANPAANPLTSSAASNFPNSTADGQIRIGLLTYGPAATIMSQYGHAALVVFDGHGRRELYELAAESPDHHYSLPWYLTPQKLIYRSQRGPLSSTLHGAFLQSRDVQLRVLNLSSEQQSKLAAGIAQAMLPGRAHFEFGVYTRNCTTRIRDLLDEVLGGQLQRHLSTSPASMSYRQHSLRAFASKPLVAIAMDLSLGRLSDHTPTRWDESFYPESLALALDNVTVDGSVRGDEPLVESVSTLFTGSPDYQMAAVPPNFVPGLAAAGAALWLLLLLGRRLSWKFTHRMEGSVLTAFGLVGLFMLYLWFVGGERVASWNENILVFNPLLLVLVGASSSRLRRWSAALILSSLTLAALLKFAPHAQANIGWILLAAPSVAYLALRTIGPQARAEQRSVALSSEHLAVGAAPARSMESS